MKRISIVLSLVVIAFISLSCKQEVEQEVKVITVEEMHTLLKLDDVQLVDVRTPKEYQAGYIKNAQNIDFRSSTFDADILKLDKTKPVILYCHSGGRSAKCTEKLQAAGFLKIYDLEGGISKWKHEKHEVIIPE